MRPQQIERIGWPLLVLVLCGALIFAHRRERELSAMSTRIKASSATIAQAVLGSEQVEFAQVGKRLALPALEELHLTDNSKPHQTLSPSDDLLILLFSDVSCSVCEESETAAAIRIATAVGTDKVIAIVHAKQRRYAAAFARVNRVPFRVFLDPENSFAKANQIRAAPLLMVAKSGEIVAALSPIAGKPEFSLPFHGAASRLLLDRGPRAALQH